MLPRGGSPASPSPRARAPRPRSGSAARRANPRPTFRPFRFFAASAGAQVRSRSPVHSRSVPARELAALRARYAALRAEGGRRVERPCPVLRKLRPASSLRSAAVCGVVSPAQGPGAEPTTPEPLCRCGSGSVGGSRRSVGTGRSLSVQVGQARPWPLLPSVVRFRPLSLAPPSVPRFRPLSLSCIPGRFC